MLCCVAIVAADSGGVFKADCIECALQEISVTLVKANGRVLCAPLVQVAQASGHAYLRGWPVPVADVVGLEG
jgi:hypothetical protein